jgi:cyclic beta-1,2-glucan synthetase
MGWERKRGKIEEFNRLLRGATDTSFSVQIGSLEILSAVRYCITLDSDTSLPRDAAKKLVGIIVHPLNHASLDPVSRRVTRGYGILQPRVSVSIASVTGSRFARVFAGHTGVDPYTTAVSDVYQDLFDEGIFTGKGLYDVDAFMAATEQRVPDNTVLSHDLFEGLYARTALVSDIEVVDDYPSSVLAHTRRQHRWVRGDWQLLPWLLPFVPARGGWTRNRLPLFARWKIRQPETQPGGSGDDRAVPVGLDVPAGQPESLDAGDAGRFDVRGLPRARRSDRRPAPVAAMASPVPQSCRRSENRVDPRLVAGDLRGLPRL